jgi:hypothetical protein
LAKFEVSDEEVFSHIVAEELNISRARVHVALSHLDGFVQVTVLIDGQEPMGVHREKLRQYAERTGGKETPSA